MAVDEVKERKRKGSQPDDSVRPVCSSSQARSDGHSLQETERRKEKARQKWQEIDDFQLEVLPTL
jgi:hypothetical protein